MAIDPIVEEIHQIREKPLKEHGGMEGYIRHLEKLSVELRDRIVHREPRTPVLSKSKAG